MIASTSLRRQRRLGALSLVAALVFLIGATSGAKSYEAPYDEGPSGGDEWNYIDAGEDGRITIGRAYVIPDALSCPAEGGYANFRVRHRLRDAARSLVIDYAEAAVDPYTIVTIVARTADGTTVGSKKIVGPLAGDGRVALPLKVPRSARNLVIDFGLELTSACPSADGGTIRFAKVTVSPERPDRAIGK